MKDMDTPNVPQLLHQVLDAHDKAIASINAANAAMGEAATQFGIAITAHGAANAEALAASRAASALLFAWESDHRDSK
jgi:glycine cleavage system regulatory protein